MLVTEPEARFAVQRQHVADLYVSLRDGVFRSLITAGLDAARAQEVTQEAFLRLYVALRTGTAVENSRSWVYRVAHNLAVDILARQSRESMMPETIRETISSERPSAEQALISKQRNERVALAIAQLSAQQRTCLEMRAQGLRYREIAEALQIRPSTVGEFLRRAIRQLRKWNLCDEDR